MSLDATHIVCELCLRDGNTVSAFSYEITSGSLRIRTYLCERHSEQAEDAKMPDLKWTKADELKGISPHDPNLPGNPKEPPDA